MGITWHNCSILLVWGNHRTFINVRAALFCSQLNDFVIHCLNYSCFVCMDWIRSWSIFMLYFRRKRKWRQVFCLHFPPICSFFILQLQREIPNNIWKNLSFIFLPFAISFPLISALKILFPLVYSLNRPNNWTSFPSSLIFFSLSYGAVF